MTKINRKLMKKYLIKIFKEIYRYNNNKISLIKITQFGNLFSINFLNFCFTQLENYIQLAVYICKVENI